MKRARHQVGSIVYDRRRKTWHYLWCEGRRRRSKLIGLKSEYPSKASAWAAAELIRPTLEPAKKKPAAPNVSTLVEQYRQEKMPKCFSTSYSYGQWFDNHILPRWGGLPLTEVQPRVTELWLHSLALSAKSRVHIRGLLRALWDYAMWRGDVPLERNPMELVRIRGASKRTQPPRSLKAEDFKKFIAHLDEPFRSIAVLCACLGLRISECLALKWCDVDWLNGRLQVKHGIVRQHLGEVKTEGSRKPISLDQSLLDVLTRWRQTTQFAEDDDFIFASPAQLGALPWSYPWVWNVYQKAAIAAQIGKLGTHSMRHSYRSWLDATGTSVAVQQKLMRHSDVRTTLNIYGDCVTNEMVEANTKVAGMALTDRVADRMIGK